MVLTAVVEAFYLNFGRKTRSRMSVLSTMFPVYLLTVLVVGVLSMPINSVLVVPNDVEMVLR